jgi:hypothetical protein
MSELTKKLDNCTVEFNQLLASNEYLSRREKMEKEKERALKESKTWLSTLNEIKVNTQKLERIMTESEKAIATFNDKFFEFKLDLLPKNFEKLAAEIKQEFGSFDINPDFDIR